MLYYYNYIIIINKYIIYIITLKFIQNLNNSSFISSIYEIFINIKIIFPFSIKFHHHLASIPINKTDITPFSYSQLFPIFFSFYIISHDFSLHPIIMNIPSKFSNHRFSDFLDPFPHNFYPLFDHCSAGSHFFHFSFFWGTNSSYEKWTIIHLHPYIYVLLFL